ncbi:hypothetical protein B0E43_10980 [Algoriphagus sp. A40]|nr:hypothetical protein B0E43_10980 [Algoriphagus sp. A40]
MKNWSFLPFCFYKVYSFCIEFQSLDCKKKKGSVPVIKKVKVSGHEFMSYNQGAPGVKIQKVNSITYSKFFLQLSTWEAQ